MKCKYVTCKVLATPREKHLVTACALQSRCDLLH